MTARLIQGDCLEAMRALSAEGVRVAAVVTDPPYDLPGGFMNRAWDRTGIAFLRETWAAAYELLPPGGHLVAFGGTRTYHRLATAAEAAGFEIRDQIGWLFGTGFALRRTMLKPGWEPILLARKPGAAPELGIEACRIPPGRFPANVVHDGSPEVEAAFAAFGTKTSGVKRGGGYGRKGGVWNENGVPGLYAKGAADGTACYADSGSASRFYYCAKASKAERDGSSHPTVKPLALMRWLVRLVTPPGGVVLDPFAGTGTTLAAALAEGFGAIGIEREPEYAADARRRLALPELANAD